jgi:hypothetical protein
MERWHIWFVPLLMVFRSQKGGWDSLLNDTTLILLSVQLVATFCPALRPQIAKLMKSVETGYRALRSKRPKLRNSRDKGKSNS